MQIAACYIRVSTDDQVEYSPDSQLRAIREYAKSHNYVIPDSYIYVDEGISGRSTKKRPSFNEMIATAKSKPKPFDAVLLWKFSRFARNRADAIVYKRLLREQCGIEVISISENLGEDKGTALILESMFEAMDEYYSINLSTEVKRSMTMKAENGEVLSIAPFGYKVENKKFVIVPEKAEIIKLIFNQFESGVGRQRIARNLSEMGVRTNRGNLPDNRFVTYILRNPVYIGKTRWSKEGRKSNSLYRDVAENDDSVIIAQGTHEPIITEEQFESVQEKLRQQKLQYRKYEKPEQVKQFALKGLVCCSACGATLILTSHKEPALQCHQYNRGVCKTSHHVSLKKLNEAVKQALTHCLSTLDFNVIPLSSPTKDNDNRVYNQLISAEKRKLDKVREAYEQGVDTLQEYKDNKERIVAAIQKYEKEQAKLNEKTTVNIQDFAKKTESVLNVFCDESATEEAKNSALRSIIHKIIYKKETKTISIIFYV